MLEARIGRWCMFSCSLNDYNSTAVCTVLVRYGRNVQLCHSTAVSQYCTPVSQPYRSVPDSVEILVRSAYFCNSAVIIDQRAALKTQLEKWPARSPFADDDDVA